MGKFRCRRTLFKMSWPNRSAMPKKEKYKSQKVMESLKNRDVAVFRGVFRTLSKI